MNNNKKIITIGLLGAIAVALGALGAHFLKAKLAEGLITPDQLDGFEKGVKYQMYHAISMLLVLLLNTQNNNKFYLIAYWLFLSGIILFSGSLYFLCTRNLLGAEWLKFLGPVTPIGGICFILGWLSLVASAITDKKK